MSEHIPPTEATYRCIWCAGACDKSGLRSIQGVCSDCGNHGIVWQVTTRKAKSVHVPPTKAELEEWENQPIFVRESEVLRLIHEIHRLHGIFDDWIIHPKLTRLWDLCRHQRNELHRVNLISDDEFAVLAEDSKSVDRLETYDSVYAENARLRALCGKAELHPWGVSGLVDARMRYRLAKATKGEV